jgi:hypothetical protein
MNHPTNVEVITEIMEFSRYGALAQMFVMDALSKQARAVADAPPEAFEGDGWKLVNPQAWRGVAREIAGKLDKHLSS